ncbi:hypothetical protein DC366_08990 [Pelagivirga sediminicola]|uniref:UspA domain-containing protein n=1 Tax=Pelagivirga sediminicola TaxID=2170575 RepID=A0A2T7G7H0_9RHOB|nr:universal stress protein [Pelagivirga sediminicola]PVA10363.1 hypothetical protein DC366_08990 [Pelagivirga sediminicola]
MPKTILAAVDKFPASDVVLVRALEVAALHDAHLRVVHVIDLPPPCGDLGRSDALRERAEKVSRDMIEDALARLDIAAVHTEIELTTGSPALRLIDLCREAPPDLIVMRAHQRKSVSDSILGSISDRVVASNVAPVLVVKSPAAHPYAEVMLATDGTDDAAPALAFVAGLLPAAAIRLVQAVEVAPQLAEVLMHSGDGQAGVDAHREVLSRNARTHLSALAKGAPRRVRTSILYGDPAARIARAAASRRVDLLAVGPGRAGLIRRAFIGSVTRRLLRTAPCDILVCAPHDG